MSEHLTFATVGVGSKDILLIRSYLSILHMSGDVIWELSDSAACDVLIINSDAEDAATYARGEAGGVAPIIITLSDTGESNNANLLLSKPIRAKGFLEVMQLAAQMHGNQQTIPAGGMGAAELPAKGAERASGSKPVYQHLFEYRDGPHATHMHCAEHWLVLDHEFGSYYSDCPQTSIALLSGNTMLQDVEIDALQTDQLEKVRGSKRGGQIDQLVWDTLRRIEKPVLDAGIDAAAHFHLTRWPDFSRLQPAAVDFRIAAMLSRHSAGIDDIVHATAASVEQIARFLNACHYLGYLHVSQEKSINREIDKLRSATDKIFSKIRMRLGLA